jgi:hypothetical protein
MSARIRLVRRLAASLVAIASIVLPPSRASANPSCNTSQTASVVLTGDLSCNGTSGILVGASGITIDLNGFTVSGDGTVGTVGIRNNGGFAGVKIIHGTIAGFNSGIEISNGADKNTIQGIDVRSSIGDGIIAFDNIDGLTIKDTSLVGNTLNGINIAGATGLKLDAVDCNANGVGIHLGSVASAKLNDVVSAGAVHQGLLVDGTSSGMTITKSSFLRNGVSGIDLEGTGVTKTALKSVVVAGNNSDGCKIDDADGTVIQKSSFVGNGEAGIFIEDHADATSVTQSVVSGNGFDGIAVGDDCVGTILSKLEASGNQGQGVDLGGSATVSATTARDNDHAGIFAVVEGNDGGKNKARGNGADPQCNDIDCGRP